MPVSKNGKLYYTKEQYEKARYCANALDYARKQGYELVRQSAGYYCLKDHDSMIFTPTGHWFWNSRGLSGGAMPQHFPCGAQPCGHIQGLSTGLFQGCPWGSPRPCGVGNPVVTRQAQPVGKPVGYPGTFGLDIPRIYRRIIQAKPSSTSGSRVKP